MLNIFNRDNLYTGFDIKEFNRLRDLLDAQKILYSYHVNNRMGQWAGRGTVRGRTGSYGQKSEETYQYEIFVHKKDFERAKRLATSDFNQ